MKKLVNFPKFMLDRWNNMMKTNVDLERSASVLLREAGIEPNQHVKTLLPQLLQPSDHVPSVASMVSFSAGVVRTSSNVLMQMYIQIFINHMSYHLFSLLHDVVGCA